MTTASVFEKYRSDAWPYRYQGRLHISTIAGGTPSDPKVIEGWLRSKWDPNAADEIIRKRVAQTMIERGIGADEAFDEIKNIINVNGFKRFPEDGGLYIEGRQLKAAIKEAASVALSAGQLDKRGWGVTNKGLLGYISEHVMVTEDVLPLMIDGVGVREPTGVVQRFVHVYSGDSIKYEEYVQDCDIDFHVITDHSFKDEDWATIWLHGEMQGVGASRSQGFGRYTVTMWEQEA